MTSRAKRLTFTIGVAALVPIVAGSVMAPGTVAAPKNGKGGPADTTFVITTKQPVYYYSGTADGTFKATGAIRDTGYVSGSADLWLSGRHGMIHIETDGYGAFVISSATPAYAHTVGATGTYQTAFDPHGKGRRWSQDPVIGTLTCVFEGSIPQ